MAVALAQRRTRRAVEADALRPRPPRANYSGYLFIAPSVLLFCTFIVGPFVYAIILSFYSWDLLTPRTFAGLDNFREMWHDPLLRKALRNTFVFGFASVVTHIVGGLLLAIGVNSLKNRYLSYFVRTSLFFPFVISWAAVALLWRYVLSPSFGIASYYAGKVGVTLPNWFSDPSWSMPAIIGIDWWHTIGFTFVIMLAGLQTVPQELVEAAKTDGAGSLRVFWSVTLPMMSPTIFFTSVITFLGAFQIFDPMQIITPGGGPNKSTLTIVMYLYQRGFQRFTIGYAAAVSLLMFVIMMAVTLLQFWGSKKWVHQAGGT
jgi:multiple sugar transport system permease protein